jgi:biopolymer transport protein ExbD
MKPGKINGLQSEINVTPLVDVVLVLLIIFMVIVPLTLHGYDVDIPTASPDTPRVESAEQQVVLSIERAGCPALDAPGGAGLPAGCRVQVNDDDVRVEDLPRHVATIFQARELPERVLFLSVDQELNYEAVMRIVDSTKSAVEGLRIAVVTRP